MMILKIHGNNNLEISNKVYYNRSIENKKFGDKSYETKY